MMKKPGKTTSVSEFLRKNYWGPIGEYRLIPNDIDNVKELWENIILTNNSRTSWTVQHGGQTCND